MTTPLPRIIGLYGTAGHSLIPYLENGSGLGPVESPNTLNDLLKILERGEDVVLARTHYDMFSHDSVEFRKTDLLFDLVGGSVWGYGAVGQTFMDVSKLNDINTVLSTATWNANRSKTVRGLSKKYLGRASADPHTVVVGHTATNLDFIVDSLPETSDWWHGVGLVPVGGLTTKFSRYYTDQELNYVAVSTAAAKKLDALGFEYGQVTIPPALKRNLPNVAEVFGRTLREASTTKQSL